MAPAPSKEPTRSLKRSEGGGLVRCSGTECMLSTQGVRRKFIGRRNARSVKIWNARIAIIISLSRSEGYGNEATARSLEDLRDYVAEDEKGYVSLGVSNYTPSSPASFSQPLKLKQSEVIVSCTMRGSGSSLTQMQTRFSAYTDKCL